MNPITIVEVNVGVSPCGTNASLTDYQASNCTAWMEHGQQKSKWGVLIVFDNPQDRIEWERANRFVGS